MTEQLNSEGDGPIYIFATECERLFDLLVAQGTKTAAGGLAADYQQRFAAWAAYLGVFARRSQCLDRRLQQTPDIQDIVIRLLDSLGQSLTLITQKIGHKLSDEETSLQYHSPSEKQTCIEIEETLDRLNRLGVTIRQSTRLSIDDRTRAFRQKVDLRFVDALLSLSVQTLYPNVHPSLGNLLSASMYHRYAKIVFLASRQTALSTRRDPERQGLTIIHEETQEKETEPGIDTQNHEGIQSLGSIAPTTSFRQFPRPSDQSSIPLSSIDTLAFRTKFVGADGKNPRSLRTSSVIINQASYPSPPRGKPNESVKCSLCTEPLEGHDLSPSRWSRHVDRDLRPYVCLVEECPESSSGYATFEEWYSHMQQHGQLWHREIHQNPIWVCPICKETECDFADHQKLLNHMEESHTNHFTRNQLETIAHGSRLFKPRPLDECLLCGFQVQEETSGQAISMPHHAEPGHTSDNKFKPENQTLISHPQIKSDRSEARPSPNLLKSMAQHIACHLQGLMFHTIRIASLHTSESTDQELQDIDSDEVDTNEISIASRIEGLSASTEPAAWSDLSRDFREWVVNTSKLGLNGHHEQVQYVSVSRLTSYWTSNALRQFINSLNLPIHVRVQTIKEDFLRIFSILVFIDQPEDITLFVEATINDHQLPLRNLPNEWRHTANSVLDEQWTFCPFEFVQGRINMRELPAKQILPIEYGELLTRQNWSSRAARIFLVNIHADCNGLVPPDVPVVFKIYEGPKAEDSYKTEAGVYLNLIQHSSKSITQCYGSFSYEETDIRIIVLEYAPNGSLLNFFDKTSPPVDASHFEMLWERLLELLDALYVLHNLDGSNSLLISGIHHNIQPDNILVFPGQSNLRFDVYFKLASFGMAEVDKVVRNEGSSTAIENEGNRIYSAPEYYSQHIISREVKPRVNCLVDVWALGAVYSDTLVWSIGGNECREKYRKKRKDAVSKLTHLKEHGFDACFHDGLHRLPAVDEFHKEILTLARPEDFISRCMSVFILEYMLTDVPCRLRPMQTKLHAQRRINEARPRFVPRSGTPDPFPNFKRPDQPLRSPPSPRDYVSVDRVYSILEKKDSRLPWGRSAAKRSEVAMEFPGMHTARSLISPYGGRHQIMLIDNFASMRPHMQKVAKTARVISYVVKVADRDGMDLYFASNSHEAQQCRSSSEVESAIKNVKSADGCCNMQKCLEDVMSKVYSTGMRPTSIYVFTDGVWEPGANPGVEMVIRQSINRLVVSNALSTTLMFQFIQFGHDTIGKERLRVLDDDCVERHGLGEYDIVDTKHCDASVPDIVIGSISRFNDSKPAIPTKATG